MWRILCAVAWAALMPDMAAAQCLLRGTSGAAVAEGVTAVLLYSGCDQRVIHGIVVWRPASESAVAPAGWQVDSTAIQRHIEALDRRRRDPGSRGYRFGGGSGADGFLTVAADPDEARVDLLWTSRGIEFGPIGSFRMSAALDTITIAVLRRPRRGSPPVLSDHARMERPRDWGIEPSTPRGTPEEAVRELQGEPQRLRRQLRQILRSWGPTRGFLKAEAVELGELQRAVGCASREALGTEKEYSVCFGEMPGERSLRALRRR